MARILNLPVKIRNGKGVGGAQVVGWLPVVRQTIVSTRQRSDLPTEKDR